MLNKYKNTLRAWNTLVWVRTLWTPCTYILYTWTHTHAPTYTLTHRNRRQDTWRFRLTAIFRRIYTKLYYSRVFWSTLPFVEQVRWFHNNVEAESERYQYIHEGGFFCLDIVPVTLEDDGLWVCTARNFIGKSSTAAHLSLTGKTIDVEIQPFVRLKPDFQ